MAQYGEYERPETLAEKLAPLVQALKRFTPLIIVLVVIAAIAFVWLYVIPWPATLNIVVVEKDTDVMVLGALVTVTGIEEPVDPETGPVTVPSRTSITVTAKDIPGYSPASTTIETEAGKEAYVELKLAKNWKLEMPSLFEAAVPQGCSIDLPFEIKNADEKELIVQPLAEGLGEASVQPNEQSISAGEKKTFTLRMAIPSDKTMEPKEGVVRIKRTDFKWSVKIRPVAKAHFDVSPIEIRCSPKEPAGCAGLISVSNRGDAPLQIIIEWPSQVDGGRITLSNVPPGNAMLIPAGGSYKLGYNIEPPAAWYFAVIYFHVVSKGCATQQLPIRPQ